MGPSVHETEMKREYWQTTKLGVIFFKMKLDFFKYVGITEALSILKASCFVALSRRRAFICLTVVPWKAKAIREDVANNVRGEFFCSKCFQVRDGRKHEYPQKAGKRSCSKFAAVVIVINGNHDPLSPCLRQRQSTIATEHPATE